MSFRFRLNEPVQKGFRRIGLEQIERIERELGTATDQRTAVHESRKALKRIRALLRLVRSGIGDEIHAAENARYRNIASILSAVRDRDILLETVAKLESLPGQVTNAALAAVKKVVVEECAQADGQTSCSEALEKLATAKKRFRRIKLAPPSFATIELGLERAYRRAHKTFAAAYSDAGDEVFHEWRKSVQLHWRHMALVSNAWPELFRSRVECARALSQILGDEHDLHVLATYARELPPERLSAMHVREIVRRTKARQRQLRQLAEPRGHLLFCEGARGHSRRIGLMWQAAERIDESEPADAKPSREPGLATPKAI